MLDFCNLADVLDSLSTVHYIYKEKVNFWLILVVAEWQHYNCWLSHSIVVFRTLFFFNSFLVYISPVFNDSFSLERHKLVKIKANHVSEQNKPFKLFN